MFLQIDVVEMLQKDLCEEIVHPTCRVSGSHGCMKIECQVKAFVSSWLLPHLKGLSEKTLECVLWPQERSSLMWR